MRIVAASVAVYRDVLAVNRDGNAGALMADGCGDAVADRDVALDNAVVLRSNFDSAQPIVDNLVPGHSVLASRPVEEYPWACGTLDRIPLYDCTGGLVDLNSGSRPVRSSIHDGVSHDDLMLTADTNSPVEGSNDNVARDPIV